MVSSDFYFFSNNLLIEIQKNKKGKQLDSGAILLFLLRTVKRYKCFYGTNKALQALEEEWRELKIEPGIKRLLIIKEQSRKYETDNENLLDTVSDVAVNIAPKKLCLLVAEDEYEKIIELNSKNYFMGFDIQTPEKILSKLNIYPLRSDFMGRLMEIINNSK